MGIAISEGQIVLNDLSGTIPLELSTLTMLDLTDFGDDVVIPEVLFEEGGSPSTIRVTKKAKENLYSDYANVIGVE